MGPYPNIFPKEVLPIFTPILPIIIGIEPPTGDTVSALTG